jgi:hypothetical protein
VLSKFSCSYVFLHNTYVVSVNYLFDIFWSYYQILFADHVIIQIFPYFFSPEITSELRVRELLDRPSVRELLASRARTAELDSRIQIPVQVPVLPAVRKPDDEYPPPPSYESVAVYAMYEPPPPYQERPWTSFSWTNQIYFEKVLPDIFTILFSNCLINFQLLCSAWISTFCRQIFFLNCCWCSDEQINVQLKKTNIIMNLSN